MTILFEDASILVVDKPAGQIVHPAPGHETGALTDELLAHCPSMVDAGSQSRPGVVHRLDRETSGVMVCAKTQAAYRKLRAAFESHRDVAKTYLAVLHGAPSPAQGRIETRMGRKPWDARRMAADVPGGVRAVTRWHVLARRGALALVRFDIETGRMHQIRVHAAHLGHPVAGDALYGDRAADARLRVRPGRLLLHAARLAIPHPDTGRTVVFEAPPPADLVYCV